MHKNMVIMKFEGVTDVPGALAMRNAVLHIDRNDALIREHHRIANRLEGRYNRFAIDQQRPHPVHLAFCIHRRQLEQAPVFKINHICVKSEDESILPCGIRKSRFIGVNHIRPHMCPKDFFEARDSSPEITVHIIGTEVLCSENDKHQFIRLIAQTFWTRARQE